MLLRSLISKHQTQIESIADENLRIAHSNNNQERRLSQQQKSIIALDINAEGFEKLIFGFIRQIIVIDIDDIHVTFPTQIVRLCVSFYNCGFENLTFNIFNKNICQALYGKIIKSHPASENVKCHRLFLSNVGYDVGIHKWKIKLFASGNSMQGGIGICSNVKTIIASNRSSTKTTTATDNNPTTIANNNNNNNSNNGKNNGHSNGSKSNGNGSGTGNGNGKQKQHIHRFVPSYAQQISATKNFRKQPWITNCMLGSVYYWCRNMKRIYTYNNGKGRMIDKCSKTYIDGDIITVILDCNLWTLKFLLNDQNICNAEHGITIKQNVKYYPVVAVYHWMDTFRVITSNESTKSTALKNQTHLRTR